MVLDTASDDFFPQVNVNFSSCLIRHSSNENSVNVPVVCNPFAVGLQDLKDKTVARLGGSVCEGKKQPAGRQYIELMPTGLWPW